MGSERIGVVGAGVMGSEIAHVVASAGHHVVVVDIDDAALARGRSHIGDINARRIAKGRMSDAEAADLAGRVSGSTEHAALADCDVVIEAAPEVLALKRELWRALDATVKPEAILASNTSGLSISALADMTSRPERVLGLHFFNPATVMKLVEVIRGTHTSDATIAAGVAITRGLGKTPVIVAECPGFLVNRILVRALAESYRYADEVGADRAAADQAVVDGGPAPMGPFALGDLIGLDTTLHVQTDLAAAYGDRFAAGTSLATEVASGRLGQKSGGGLVTGSAAPGDVESAAGVAERYYLGAFDEACRCIEEEISALDDIDRAMQLGAGWDVGPLAWADAAGLATIAARLDHLPADAQPRFAQRTGLRDRIDQGNPFIRRSEETS